MQRHQQGLALPVVILFMALILVAMLVATSYLTLGAQGRNVSETQATRALFAADSLVNRVDSTVADLPPLPGGSSVTADAVEKYLKDNGLGSLTLLDGSTAELLKVTGADSNFDIVFTGNAGGDEKIAKKVIIKTYKFNLGAGGQMVYTAGAVTTYGDFSSNASPMIKGSEALKTTEGWFNEQVKDVRTNAYQDVKTTTDITDMTRSPIQVTLSNATNQKPGDYMRLGGITFKVMSKSGNNLSLEVVGIPPIGGRIMGGANVLVTPLALTKTVAVSGKTVTIEVNDPGAFGAHKEDGDLVSLKLQSGSSVTGRVTARDMQKKTITLEFASSLPMNQISEGTPIQRDVPGVVGAQDVEPPKTKGNGNNSVPPYNYLANDKRIRNPRSAPAPNETPPCPSGNLLFCDTFHMDLDAFKKMSSLKKVTSGNMSNLSGLNYLDGSVGNRNDDEVCGSGILVITGNWDRNQNKCSFRGLIYVMGDVKIKGHFDMTGGMVVEGATDMGSSGSNRDGGKVTYDPMALREVSALLGGNNLQPQAGTWRQK